MGSQKFNFLSAILAFFIWGSWACYVNNNSSYHGLVSGITQGAASFAITLFIAHAVTRFFNLLPKTAIVFILPSVLTICITGSALFVIHSLIQTPRIFYTIAPAITVAFIFCLFVTLKLRKSYNEQHQK